MGRLWNGGGKAHGAGMARGASGGRALPCLRRALVGRGRRTRRPPQSHNSPITESELKAETAPLQQTSQARTRISIFTERDYG